VLARSRVRPPVIGLGRVGEPATVARQVHDRGVWLATEGKSTVGLHLSQIDEADELLTNDPLALLIGMLLARPAGIGRMEPDEAIRTRLIA
jgi:hypothetical protein